ncbi:hypothetical protein [Nocardia asteroides]|uniref:hypothetical protein n=1 Tax=Nocardia asteroides TaxID=1824 RepID=UPI0033FA0D34
MIVTVSAVLVLTVAVWIGVRTLAAPAGRNVGGLPFTWTAVQGDSGSWAAIFQQSVTELGPPPPGADQSDEAFPNWVIEHQGVPSGQYDDQHGTGIGSSSKWITLRARSADLPVMITDLNVEVIERLPALDGAWVAARGWGGERTGRYMVVDLDGWTPRVLEMANYVEQPGENNRAVPMKFPYQISTQDYELFYVEVRTTQYVKWRIRIEWSTGVTAGTTIIDDQGRPFEVSAPGPNAHACMPNPEGTEWIDNWESIDGRTRSCQ